MSQIPDDDNDTNSGESLAKVKESSQSVSGSGA